MAERNREADWNVIVSLLPEGWRALSTEMGLVPKLAPHIGQKVRDIEIALRLVLHYVAQRGSMRMTTTTAAAAGIVDITQPAFFKWMFKIGPYLEALVTRMVEPGRFDSEQWGGYRLVVADATTVERAGAKGTTARLHYALHLADLSPRFVRVTDETIGETMRNFDLEPGELWIVDRGYCNPQGVLHTVRRGADVLVRYNRHTLSLYEEAGARLEIPGLLAKTWKRGRAEEKEVRVILSDGSQAFARLCWLQLPTAQAQKARARAVRAGTTDAVELDCAEYIAVLTTAPSSKLSAEQAIELYRARWQVELDFKREKSIGQLDMLPTLLPQTIRSWLCAKVLLSLIARKLASQPVAIPPSGLGDVIFSAIAPPTHATRSRRRALVRAAACMGHDPLRDPARHSA